MSKETRFTDLIKENEGIIYKITSVYTQTSYDQQDLYQEIVVQLWGAFDRFKNESKVSTWIYRVALNTAISSLRKTKRKGHEIPIDKAVLNRADVHDPVLEDRIRLLYTHINDLQDIEKGIMILYLEDKRHDEIAEIVGISVSNVGTRLSRIKEKLKTKMVKQ